MSLPLEVIWRLPLHGDGRALSAEAWNRGDYAASRKEPHPFARTGVQRDGYTYYDHLSQIARAADLARFDGLWLPYSAAGEEPLIVASGLAREAPQVTFIPTLRAPLISPVYAAKIAVSFQRLTGGRLGWHLASEDDGPQPWHGQSWTLAEQIARTGELLDIARGVWHHGPFTYEGRYYHVAGGGFPPALQGSLFPRVYLAGETPEAYDLSARHADVHLLPLEPAPRLQEKIARLTALAQAHGRQLQFGLEADLVARHAADDAWSDLRRRWNQALAGNVIPISAAADAHLKASLPAFDDLIDAEAGHIWSGLDLVRPGPRRALVGSYEQIAARLEAYAQAGITTFVLSAQPHLEEAYQIGEHVLPRLRARLTAVPPTASSAHAR